KVAVLSKISPYRLFSFAHLLQYEEYPKDKIILQAGEMSKALFFITAGTVEVIQVKKRRIRQQDRSKVRKSVGLRSSGAG
ncbi:unnamed protein product, partial [Choristocarpus tenellus]